MNSSTHSSTFLPSFSVQRTSNELTPSTSRALVNGGVRLSQENGYEMSTMSNSMSSRVATDLPAPTTVSAPTISPGQLRWYRLALYSIMFLEGWNDASVGPLLPLVQKKYHLNFTIVSMLFVTSAAGFGIGAAVNIHLTDRYGLGRIMAACSALQIIAYALIAAALPFPVMCLGYGMAGFTMALVNAQANVFTTYLPGNASSAMGLLHGFYGIGAMSAPLAGTQFAKVPRWSFFWLISLGLAAYNLALCLYVFGLKRLDELLPTQADPGETAPLVEGSKYRQIFRQKLVYMLATFTLVYVGTEVTIGGWIVTFLDELRGGGTATGYVSSGFFGGMTLGRFILWPVTDWIGKRRAIFAYGAIAIGLQLVVWLVPNLVTNAVAVSLVGMALGPLYPIVMNTSTEILPRWILAGSIGFVASVGQVGSALLPFLTGLLATNHGVQVLQPLVIGLLVFMMGAWGLFLANSGRRTD